jgi:hypothetical protein
VKTIEDLLEPSAAHAKIVHDVKIFFGERPLEE